MGLIDNYRSWFRGDRTPARAGPTNGKYDNARALAIMHVPKTSGTSLTGALVNATQPKQAFSGFDHSLFGDFRDFSSFAPDVRAMIYKHPAQLPDADFIAGHFAYSTLRERYQTAQLITVLREPTSRLLSHWLFWRGHDEARLAPWGAWAASVRHARRPLAEFLAEATLACQNDNQITRMLLWPHKLIPVDGFIEPLHYRKLAAEAISRLADFSFVNIVENPHLRSDLQQWLDRPLHLGRDNETAAIPPGLNGRLELELTEETMSLLAQNTSIDQTLWQAIAHRVIKGRNVMQVRERAIMVSAAKYSAILWERGQTP